MEYKGPFKIKEKDGYFYIPFKIDPKCSEKKTRMGKIKFHRSFTDKKGNKIEANFYVQQGINTVTLSNKHMGAKNAMALRKQLKEILVPHDNQVR